MEKPLSKIRLTENSPAFIMNKEKSIHRRICAAKRDAFEEASGNRMKFPG